MNTGISAINERVKEESAFIATLRAEIGKIIVGQNYLVDRLYWRARDLCTSPLIAWRTR